MFRSIKVLLVALVAIVIAGGAYAYAAANTVDASAAGYTANVVAGYAVSNVVYDLDATDPTMVDKITFAVAPSTGTALAALVKLQTVTEGTWTDCTLVAGTAPSMSVTCTYGALLLTDVTAFNVVASSSADPLP